ncbi:MAG TPA: hypothetical protein VK912_19050 [Longimicrobiales bacterium]|nr:hypothetical protein [Longimicrobiales bacterium]
MSPTTRAWLAALSLLAACDGDPTAPMHDVGPPQMMVAPSAAITGGSAAAPGNGSLDSLMDGAFTFLAPFAAGPTSGEFDPSVLTALVLEVCEISACDGPPIATYTSTTGPGSETIRVSELEELFIVNWMPSDLGLPSPATYRLRVRVAGLALGHVDVQLVSNGSDLRNAATGETLAFLDRRGVPVKFSVRRNVAISAWLRVAAGASAADIADLLVTDGGLDAAATASILVSFGYPAADVAVILRDVFAYTADETVAVLRGLGADAFDIGAALVTGLGHTVEESAALLSRSGFDAETVFAATYRVGVDVLGNPVDFALRVAVATMHGLGYALDDFRDGLLGGLHAWSEENITDALGLSGYAMSDLVPFMLDVMGLTVDVVMAKAESWGVPLSDVVDALVDAGAAIEDIAAGAVAAFDATSAELGQALADAGATALEIGTALMDAYNQTLDETAVTLGTLGFQAEAVFNAVYDLGVNVLGNPADFALNLALAVMKGAGYTLNNFRDALMDPLRAWTQENIIDALGLSGFATEDLVDFMINTMGMTADRVADIAQRWGVPVDEFVAAMYAAGQQVEDFADAMIDAWGMTDEAAVAALKDAGYLAADVGEWIYGRLSSGGTLAFENAAKLLADAGYAFDHVAAWVWTRAGGVTDRAVVVLRYGGYSAREITRFLFDTAGRTARTIFVALKAAGFAAADAAEAVFLEAGASLVQVGAWLSEVYGLAVDATLGILSALGATLGDMISVASGVYGATLDEATALLTQFGFSVVDIIAGWAG